MTTAKDRINAQWTRIETDVKTAGRHLWLAGLGAVGSADEMSREALSDLIRRGREVDAEAVARRPWDQAVGRMKHLGERVEQQIEDGVSKTLNRLGAPSRRDVEALSERVAVLTRQVESLR